MNMSPSPSRFTAAPVIGLAVTAALAVGAIAVRPQGDITRLTPFLVAAGLVWTAVAGFTRGPRAAAQTACWLSAAGMLATAVYLFALAPINVGECGTLAETVFVRSDKVCIQHGHPWAIAGLTVGALADVVGAVSLRRRDV